MQTVASRRNARLRQSANYALGRRLCVLMTVCNAVVMIAFVLWWAPLYDGHLSRTTRSYEPGVAEDGARLAEGHADEGKEKEKNKVSSELSSLSSSSERLRFLSARGGGNGGALYVRRGRAGSRAEAMAYFNKQHDGVGRNTDGGKDDDEAHFHYEGDGHDHNSEATGGSDGQKRNKRGGSNGGGGGDSHVRRRVIPFLRHAARLVAADRAAGTSVLERWVEAHCGAQQQQQQHQSAVGKALNDENDIAQNNNKAISPRSWCPHSLAYAQGELRRSTGHRVLVPPDALLDFTLNGTIPLLYEYRDDNDVLLLPERTEAEAEVAGKESSGGSTGGHTTKEEENGGDNSGDTVATVATTSLTTPTRMTNQKGTFPFPPQPAWVEGKDYLIGRRYFSTAHLRRSFADQLWLMGSSYHYASATLPSAAAAAAVALASPAADFFLSDDNEEAGGSGGKKKASSGDEGNSGVDVAAPLSLSSLSSAFTNLFSSSSEASSSAAPSAFLFNPSASLIANPFSGQSRLFAALTLLSSFIAGREVAVIGSLETPLIEVALLTLGRARRVHSIDYRPILSADRRIVGHDALSFWRRVARRRNRDRLARMRLRHVGSQNENEKDGHQRTQQQTQLLLQRRILIDDSAAKKNDKEGKEEEGSNSKRIANADEGEEKEKGSKPTTRRPLPNAPAQFPLVVAFSSFQHAGLGRYGDPLDSFGDVRAMAEAWSILAPGGLLLLSVPVGNDCLVFNAYRVYGRRRLPLLLYGWEIVGAIGLEDRTADELFYRTADGSAAAAAAAAMSGSAAGRAAQRGGLLGRVARALRAWMRWFAASVASLFSGGPRWSDGPDKGARDPSSPTAKSSSSHFTSGRSGGEEELSENFRFISRWEDGQCDGTLQNSPLFILRKVGGGNNARNGGLRKAKPPSAADTNDDEGRALGGGEKNESDTRRGEKSNTKNTNERVYYPLLDNDAFLDRIPDFSADAEAAGDRRSLIARSDTVRLFTPRRTFHELRKIRGLLGSFPLFHRPR